MADWKAPEKMPRHVAIIMDGNGRWAKKRGLPRAMGHRQGVEAMRNIIRESNALGIEALTFYAFSTENWKRSAEEVGVLMRLFLEIFRNEIDELDANNVRIRIIGDLPGLPKAQREACERAVVRTGKNTGLRLNVALNYGARDELRRAMQRIAQEVKDGALAPEDIDEALIADHLDTAGLPDVDLLIRASGEQRLSNFLLYQAAYAEFLYPLTLWPDFDRDAYHDALDAYAGRDRRFGGRKEESV